MLKRSREEQSKHDQEVKDLAAALDYDEKFQKVHTDDITDDYPNVNVINGRRPDLLAEYEDYIVIIEVETEGSINDDHTIDQWKAFQQAVDDDNETFGGFVVVVPSGLKKEARERAAELEVKPEIWEREF